MNLVPYYLSKFIPSNKDIWVFGSWYGFKYADNPKYFFEYVCNNHKNIKCIWLSKSKDVIGYLRSRGYVAHYTYSLKGYWFSARSGFSFISTDFDDINRYVPSKRIVNLWHGSPMKKIVYDDELYNVHIKSKLIKSKLIIKLLALIFPFRKLAQDFDLVISSSFFEAKNLSTAFKIPINKVAVTGLPRNDIFHGKSGRYNPIKKIIYMPTHRLGGDFDIQELFIESLEEIDNNLKKCEISLYLKLHFYHSKFFLNKSFDNIHFIGNDLISCDPHAYLSDFDLLITDYSSIFFDYLLLNRPIIFAAFDIDNYTQTDRQFYFDYEATVPGPICRSWSDVISTLSKINNNEITLPNLLQAQKIFHKHTNDGKNSKRVFENLMRFNQ